MKIERKRYVVMRKNRTEIWGGCARNFEFRPIDNFGEFAIKTYRTERQAHTCSSWDRDFEVVEVIETLESTEGYRKQSEGAWITTHFSNDGQSPRGRTIIYKTYTCDVCGKSNGRRKTPYCPNCGAKMKGGE
jgi:rubrerythrin